MEVVAGLLAFLVAATVALAFPLIAILALVRANRAQRGLEQLEARVAELSRRAATGAAATPTPSTPLPAAPAPAAAAPVVSPEPEPAVRPAPVRPAAPARPASPDASFAASLGPRILVGAGGLAVVVFLALFVRYAWENDWVGPLGRVLSAASFSLALVVGGLRVARRRYRPLGQGLASAGFGGLYVTAWAAHALYGLIGRGTAGALLVVVVAAAALIAARANARLLAGLAWFGGYLAPVLLSTGEDRGEALFAYLLLLAGGALWLDRRKAWAELPLLAALGTTVLYSAWHDGHFSAGRFAPAAAAVVALTALFALGTARRGGLAPLLAGLAVLAGGLGAVAMTGAADRPVGLLVLLAALALVADLAASRFAGTRPVAALLAALAVSAWLDGHDPVTRSGEALLLGLGTAAAHAGLLGAASLRGLRPGLPGALAHVAASLLAFTVLQRALRSASDSLFVPLLALALVHLLLGLEARRRGTDRLRVRTTLGLAALFLTLAIPVGLGLNATTLAWAGEGVLLLWLGVRQRDTLARGFGYAALLLAVCRLLLSHLPLHAEPFVPVLNAAFGMWLGVIAAIALARRLARSQGEDAPAWLDGAAVLLLGPLALALLLGLCTGETWSYFDHVARAARAEGDHAAALRAERQGGLAVSVLFTVFAAGLLAAGLALRSLPLFYASYALFAITAAKVVLVDAATLPTLYRMLSFLALGALLLAGAWLNLRFRERLVSGARSAG